MQSQPNNPLQKNTNATYRSLVLGLGFVAIAFPPLLYIGGKWCKVDLADTMSAYYHHPGVLDKTFGDGVMRDWFVGLLFFIGITLILYRGYTWLEDWALNLAGTFAIGVAINPMDWTETVHRTGFPTHFFCAGATFAFTAYVAIWRAGDTVTEEFIPDKTKRKRYLRCYFCLGVAMVALPFIIWGIHYLGLLGSFPHYGYYLELIMFVAFGSYWVIKHCEIANSEVGKGAASGKLLVDRHTLMDTFSAIRITRIPD